MGAFAFSTGGGSGGGGGSPGGSSPQIQFNSSGSFAGTTNLEFDLAGAALRGLTGLTGGVKLFNTVDITTNTEFLRTYWGTNVAYLITDTQGSGTTRELRVGTYNNGNNQNLIRVFGGTGTPFITFQTAASSNTAFTGYSFAHGALSAASGSQTILGLTGTISQSSTAAYTALLLNITETSTGSGAKNLILGQVGGVNRFAVSNNGSTTISSTATSGLRLFNTVDETTHLEMTRMYYASNVFNIENSAAGSGVIRELRLGNTALFIRIFAASAATQFEFQGSSSSVVATNGMWRTGLTSTASSGAHIFQQFSNVVNQSGTAGYTAVDINVTETATGSGVKKLIDARVGGATQFSILNNGRISYITANTATTVGAAGGAAALPATPLGYILIDVNGTAAKVAYYNV